MIERLVIFLPACGWSSARRVALSSRKRVHALDKIEVTLLLWMIGEEKPPV